MAGFGTYKLALYVCLILTVRAERRHQGQKKYTFRTVKQMIFHVGLLLIGQFPGPVQIQQF